MKVRTKPSVRRLQQPNRLGAKMASYTALSGETIRFPDPDPVTADFLARARVAASDLTVSINDMIELVYGPDNPLLDKTILPGRPMVTKAVFVNPVYHVLADLIGVKRVQLGLLDMAAARAAYTLSVPEAAKRLGITPAAVRAAITGKRLGAIYENGQWWLRPESVASYKVSNRGPKRASRKHHGRGPRPGSRLK